MSNEPKLSERLRALASTVHTVELIEPLREMAAQAEALEAREPKGYTATDCSEIARKRYADEPRKTFQQQQYAQGLEDGYGHALFEHIGK